MSLDHVIDIHDLRKTYRDGLFGRRRVEALRGVTFQVNGGEIFGLLGPNGAGKTTLIKVLLGIVRKSGGRAALLGRPPGDRKGRRQVGYLPENHRIPAHHTGYTALEYYGGLSGLSPSEIRARRGDLLELVGLGPWGDTSVKKYSKGMLQRLGLAQALLHDPKLLVLDEPTDGVDPVGRAEMRELWRRLKDSGKTVFINSHLLQEIELVCDRVAILVQGLVERVGRIDEITARAEIDVTWTLAGDEGDIRAVLAIDSATPLLVSENNQVQISLTLADQAAVDRAVDGLRARGVSIVSMSRPRRTLEEAFLDTVRQGNGAPGPVTVGGVRR
ncbi:MAG TPA: ABC transporter ATP-binding protein [Pirellulales bacterium]|nr:ABC transporter ATP-binding protein [Pirellulales bacterium]